MSGIEVPEHTGLVTRTYLMHYPEHPARADDPHYLDFETYRRTHVATAECAFAAAIGDKSECSGGLELHHAHVEFSLQNGISLAHLEFAYPGISDPNNLGAWVESGANLIFYCAGHHRGPGGVHVAASADFEASKFVIGLITAKVKK